MLPIRPCTFLSWMAFVIGLAGCDHAALKVETTSPKRAIQAADSLEHEISACNSEGFRHRANVATRKWIASRDPTLGQLIGITHPTRPMVNFESKPDPRDRSVRDQCGIQSILYALQLHGDACDAIESAKEDRLFESRDAEYCSLLVWVMSVCQRDDELSQLLTDLPKECRSYPTFWIGLGNFAKRRSADLGDTSAISADELADLYRMALRLEPNHLIACNAAITALDQSNPVLKMRLKQTASDILDIQTLVNDIVGQTTDPAVLIPKLAEIQNRSGRPIESIAWQTLLINNTGGDPKLIARLNQSRAEALTRYPDGYDWTTILGDLNPARVNRIADELIASIQANPILTADSLPTRPDDDRTSVTCRLEDVTQTAGVDFQWLGTAEPIEANFRLFEPLGGGAAWLDFDCDGRCDLFLVQASGDPLGRTIESDKLYRNLTKGSIRFVDVSVLAQIDDAGKADAYGHGATAGDWNQDGWEDIVVAGVGGSRLWINQGDGTFVESRALETTGGKRRISLSVAIADVTGNAIPDLVEVNYVDDASVFDPIRFDKAGHAINLPAPTRFQPAADLFYRQSDDGAVDVIAMDEPATGMGVVIGDFINDGSNQIYISNDQMPNQFWTRILDSDSQGQLTRIDSASSRGLALGADGKSLAGMGIAAADFDGNGMTDFHVTNFVDEWVNLYSQTSQGLFQDRSVLMNLASASGPMVGFGCQAMDFDNDGDEDLIVANGHIENLSEIGVAFRMPTQVFHNVHGRFTLASEITGSDYFLADHLGRSIATCDMDDDGNIDVVVTHVLEPTRLFQNQTATDNHFLSVQLVATTGERSATGSTVTVNDGSRTRTFACSTGDGYLARNEPTIHVGLGEQDESVKVIVRWNPPSTRVQTFESVPVDGRILLIEGQADPWTFGERETN